MSSRASVLGVRLREHFDWALFAAASAIAIVGVINLYSAASVARTELYITQIYWLALGAGVAVLVAAIDYRHYERFGYVIYGIGILLLGLLFVVGREVRGSTRWLGVGAFSLQPSELMKICLVVALAKFLHNDAKQEGRNLRDLVIPGAMVALPMVFILLQPDLGTALILALTFLSIMMLTRLKLRSFLTLVLVGVISAPITWAYLLKDYQKERLLSFLKPSEDVLGRGWHARQSIVAIGSGRWFGKGFLQGTQNQHRFLPDQHTDFPFPVWAEEHGFVGAILLLGIYFFLVVWAVKIASQAKDRFGAVIAVGVGAILFWHTIINVGMVTGLLPVVGVTLPLFSYGGSSVLTVLIGIGLLMNVSMRRFRF
ncbi:MAG: rod shape-determining protein RodA [Deltaproteobacteria bacterium]|nr:rod shape-determining protein RodA [Deltaproteobacteria bacterium]